MGQKDGRTQEEREEKRGKSKVTVNTRQRAKGERGWENERFEK